MNANKLIPSLLGYFGLSLWAGFMLLGSCSIKENDPRLEIDPSDTLGLLEGEWTCVDAYWKNVGTGQRVENDPRLPALRRDYWIVKNGEVRRYPMIGYEQYPMGPSMARPFRITVDWGRMFVSYFWGNQWMCEENKVSLSALPHYSRLALESHAYMIEHLSKFDLILSRNVEGNSIDEIESRVSLSMEELSASNYSVFLFKKRQL